MATEILRRRDNMNIEEIMEIALNLSGQKEIPYDSEIYVHGENIKRVLFGIDISTSELILAQKMKCDCVIAHHPLGNNAVLNFYKVIDKHAEIMIKNGIPEEKAYKSIENLKQRLKIANHSRNYTHLPLIAEKMKMPLMNIHNPLDEIGRRIMQETVDKAKPERVKDVVDALYTLPEFQRALTEIEIVIGDEEGDAKKTVIAHGAGTNGGYDIAKTYFEYGFCVVYIHINMNDYLKLKKEKGNLIVSGHIASDSVGINPFIKALEEEGIEVVRISGIYC